MNTQLGDLNIATTTQGKGFEKLLTGLESQRNLLASTPAVFPTKGWITSKFGYRKSPFTELKEFHEGLDISNREGTPVIAPANGVISATGYNRLIGNFVMIDHGYGIVTSYLHLNKILVKRDQTVKRGALIAQIGSTGRSTGPHLHYAVRLNGAFVDPEKYILD